MPWFVCLVLYRQLNVYRDLQFFVQELSYVFPNAQRMNRGGQVVTFPALPSIISSSMFRI